MTTTYLLDTNMFSYIAKGTSPAARAEFQRLSQDGDAVLCISAITEAKVRFGMAKRSLSRTRCLAIEGLFANLQILPWGSDEAAAYAQARALLEPQGLTVATLDDFGNLAWPTSAVCSGPPLGTLMLRVLGPAGA